MGYKYTLEANRYHYTNIKAPGNGNVFENEWLLICYGNIRVNKGYSWDGCTCAPDFYCTTKGSIFHDAIYQFAEDIADHWQCSVKDVLRFADKVFYEKMRQWSSKWNPIPWIYYRAVRLAGYPFHQLMRRFNSHPK